MYEIIISIDCNVLTDSDCIGKYYRLSSAFIVLIMQPIMKGSFYVSDLCTMTTSLLTIESHGW